MTQKQHPMIIQGGMGIAVSDWQLAKAVSLHNQLGVVSGTGINSVLVRRLQDGDPEGHMRRALEAFPFQQVSDSIIESYWISGGRKKDSPYKRAPLYSLKSPKNLLQLTVAAAFVEVWLAKEGHGGVIGINLLEKIQIPNMACLYGALLAKVDYVLMGAGIPKEIPGVLTQLCLHQESHLKISVEGGEDVSLGFNPQDIFPNSEVFTEELQRPFFFPIVSSAALALNLKRKSSGPVDGFIVEGPLAGGHNAPPRGPLQLNERGEPIYGPRDEVSFEDMKAISLPFWMAGDYATPEKLQSVQAKGAHGIQVGTLFAFSEESGMLKEHKQKIIFNILNKQAPLGGWIFTDPRSSPTGFPFKASMMEGTLSEDSLYKERPRICDLGYLRHVYKKKNEEGYGLRCPAEPVDDYLKKEGSAEDTVGRKCLCNALMADVGLPQMQSSGYIEKPLITAGDDLNHIGRILKKDQISFNVKDILSYLLENSAEIHRSSSLSNNTTHDAHNATGSKETLLSKETLY